MTVDLPLEAHPPEATNRDHPGRAARPLFVLAATEARRLLQHPAVVASLVLAVVPWLVGLAANPTADDFTDLTSASWEVQYPMLLLAAGAFVGADLLASRPHRHGTDELEGVLSLPPWQRALALCLATTAPAVLGLVVVVVQLTVLAGQPGAVGTVQVAEVLAVPAVVVLAGLLGVLVGMLAPSPAVGFVALMVLAIGSFVGLAVASSPLRWLSFVAGENPFATPPMPSDLVQRPSWWHLAWLFALAAITVAVLLRRAGLRVPALDAVIGLAVVVAIAAASMQLRPTSDEERLRLARAETTPSSRQVCEEHAGVVYCAFPELRNRIRAWAAIVEAQSALVGDQSDTMPSAVRQHLPLAADANGLPRPLPEEWSQDDARAGTPGALPVSTRWSAGGVGVMEEEDVFGFAAVVAARIVTGAPLDADGYTLCGGPGALSLWLSAATPDTHGALETLLAHGSGGGMFQPVLNTATMLRWGRGETELALAMLAAEPGAVRAAVHTHWRTLTDPSTDVAAAARLLGLPAPPPVPAHEDATCS